MDQEELTLIRKIKYGQISADELTGLYYDYSGNYRIHFFLIQHPSFPEKFALNIVPKLFPVDLIRVIKNRRTNPFVRKRAELEFFNKYQRFPLGEKISYMKFAPLSLLEYFIREQDEKVLETMLNNPQCTEELILKMINAEHPVGGKHHLYQAMMDTEWYKRRWVAEAIANDKTAPIKIMIMIIPFVKLQTLKKLFESVEVHPTIKNGITEYLNKRVKTDDEDILV